MTPHKSACRACGRGYAFGGEVGDHVQRKIESEMDVCEEGDSDEECKAKKAAAHAGVSLAREAVGAALEFHKGGEVVDYSSFAPQQSRKAQLRKLLAHHMKGGRR